MMSENKIQDEEQIKRRDFLKLGWGAVAALAMAEMGIIGLRFLSPKTVEGEFGSVITVGNVQDFPPGSVTTFPNGRFHLVRLEDGGLLALYRKCTHLGCAVPWDQAAGQFICPCHASAFETGGTVINPPAPRPLDRFPITIEDGVILVDTGTKIERDRTNPDEIVYA
jgi:cytochrome b6-f complex iron-sulfur subunit